MHEGDVKPFDEMTREELIAAAQFWRSEYERVIAGGAGYTIHPKCASCGAQHDPRATCTRLPDGTVLLNFTFN